MYGGDRAMLTDHELLERYAGQRDADAFAELVKRHAGMVHGVCARITGDRHEADDLTQECFLVLARQAGSVRSAVAGWLHAVATNRALNALRRAATRRRHEQEAARTGERETTDELTWREIAWHVDAAIEQLPADMRDVLVAHYLHGQTQRQLAGDMGVNQSTISRRLDRGIELLRGRLKREGVMASVGALAAGLAGESAHAAPGELMGQLNRIGMTGVGPVATRTARWSMRAVMTWGGVAAVVAGVAVAGYFAFNGNAATNRPQSPKTPAVSNDDNSQEEKKVTTTLVRNDEQVVIEGLEEAWWGGRRGGQNSVTAAMAFALQAQGQDVTYEYLMGVSGAAFRLQVHIPWGCGSSPHSFCGFNCVEKLTEAQGIAFEDFDFYGKEPGEQPAAAMRQALMKSIDAGAPALYSSEESSLIVGYKDDGATFILRRYADGKPGYKQVKKLPWTVNVLHRKRKPMAKREAAEQAIRLARELMAMETVGTTKEGNPAYAAGFNAYKAWLQMLANEQGIAKIVKDDPDLLRGVALGNGHTYNCLVDARRAAAVYLKDVAGAFDQPVRGHLLKAAEHYAALADRLCPGRVNAPYHWQCDDGRSWTREQREAQIELLKFACVQDEKAIEELEKAAKGLKESAEATPPE